MFGREAEYLQSDSISSIIIEDGEVAFDVDVSRSETDLLYFKLGIVIGF